MSEFEIVFANNRAIISFYLLIAGFLVLYSNMSDIHIRSVFCLSRKKNMEYVRKQALLSIVCFVAMGIGVYEMLSFIRGYAHVTPLLVLFFLTGGIFVVFWLEKVTVTKIVGEVIFGVGFIVCTPLVVLFAIVRYGVKLDGYLGYAALVMAVMAVWQYKGFMDGWRKGDLA